MWSHHPDSRTELARLDEISDADVRGLLRVRLLGNTNPNTQQKDRDQHAFAPHDHSCLALDGRNFYENRSGYI